MDLLRKCSNLSLSCISMKMLVFFNLFSLFTLKPTSASNVLRPRGVSLTMASFYDPSRPFSCFDGSGTISFNRINDDYCDCQDGSDEPGTAACINGIFHCNNVGHVGMDIASSFVNDGVCDCCDTSDEYASNTDCLDECQVLGEAARIEARRKAEEEMEGYNIRLKMAEEGARLKKEREAHIAELQKDKEKTELEHAEKLAQKEMAEAPEKEALEQYKSLEEEMKARKEKERKEKDERDARDAFAHLDVDQDGQITVIELQSKETFDTNRDGEVSEDEAKFYLQQKESIDLETFLQSGWALMKPTYMHHSRMFTPPTTEQQEEELTVPEPEQTVEAIEEEAEKDYETDFDSEEEEMEEEAEDYAEELEDEDAAKGSEEAAAKEEEEEEVIQYDPETQRLIDLANAAREDYKTVDETLREIVKEIQSLQEGLQKDFGPNEEFRVFENECFEFTDREYTYKLCPFDSAVQKPKNGHGETRLGSWGSWAGVGGNPYSVMMYSGGQNCWNGPQRSAEVRLSCGVKNELTSVSEPNRCEYLFLFTTPAICVQLEHGETTHQHTEL